MATNSQIIADALRDIGVISEIETPSAEQGQHGLRQLNNMLEMWTENDCELGYFKQSSTTAQCPIPEWSEAGVKAGLGLFLAPGYGVNLSREFVAKAQDAVSMIGRKCISEKVRGANMDFMPMGEGQHGRSNILNDT